MPHSFERYGTMALRMCLLVVLALLLAANPTEAKHRQLESLEELLERLIVEHEAEAEELKEDEEEEEETGGGEDEEDEEDEAEDELKKKEEEKKRKKKEEEEKRKKEEEEKRRKEEEEEQKKKEEEDKKTEEEEKKKDEEEASKPRSLHRDRDSQITKTTETPLQEATTIQYSTTPRSLGHNIYTKPGSPNKKCYCEEITDTIWPFTVASGGRSRQEKGGGDSGAREAKGNDGSSENNDGKSGDGVGDEARGNDGSSENNDGKSSDGVGDKESDNPKRDNSGDSERVKRSPIDAGLRQPCLGCGPKPKPDSLQNERHLFHHQCLH